MYHTPVPLSLEQQDSEQAELAEQAVGADGGSKRLREAHLHNGQAQTRALFAPYFAGTAVGAALLVAWALFAQTGPVLIGVWLAAVGVVNAVYFRRVMQERSNSGSRSAQRGPALIPVAEAIGLGGIWASLPTWTFSHQPYEAQVVIVLAMAS